MKGRQDPQPTLFACVQLEQMIPHDHILRRIQQAIKIQGDSGSLRIQGQLSRGC